MKRKEKKGKAGGKGLLSKKRGGGKGGQEVGLIVGVGFMKQPRCADESGWAGSTDAELQVLLLLLVLQPPACLLCLTRLLQVAVRAGGGLPPAGEAIAVEVAGEAQSAGRGSRKGRQVAADDRRVQFVQG